MLPGDASEGVKDPVILFDADGWYLWASYHPLDDADATDRMITRYATSDDGVAWTLQGVALACTQGSWDTRGVRFSAVLRVEDGHLAFYDGRETATQNGHERTGDRGGHRRLAPQSVGPARRTGVRLAARWPAISLRAGANDHRVYPTHIRHQTPPSPRGR